MYRNLKAGFAKLNLSGDLWSIFFAKNFAMSAPAFFRTCLTGLSLLLSSGMLAQVPIRVMHYNLLMFGDCDGVTTSQKYQWLGTILEHVQPDIFTINELIPQTAYLNGIKALSFDYTTDMAFFPLTNQANSNIVNGLFYNQTRFQPAAPQSTVIPNSLRDINAYRLIYLPSILGGSTDTLFLTCVVAHFKAGEGNSEEQTRLGAANAIMTYLGRLPEEELVLVMGDFNLYSHLEPAFQAMVNNSNPAIRLVDVSGKANGWNGSPHARIHTQSPRISSSDCGSGGGMDDRFDFVLANQRLIASDSRIRIDSASYQALGNNGLSFDGELSCTGNTTVPFSVCLALKQMSDHLPVVVNLQADATLGLEQRDLLVMRVEVLGNRWLVRAEEANGWRLTWGSMSGQWLGQTEVRPGQDLHTLEVESLPAGWYWIGVENRRGERGWAKVWKD